MRGWSKPESVDEVRNDKLGRLFMVVDREYRANYEHESADLYLVISTQIERNTIVVGSFIDQTARTRIPSQ